jgi:hypothetical protein
MMGVAKSAGTAGRTFSSETLETELPTVKY